MTLCEHCLKFSGIHNATRRCCQVRLIAHMPPKQQAAAVDQVRVKRGDAAEARLRELVAVEYERWKAYRTGVFLP